MLSTHHAVDRSHRHHRRPRSHGQCSRHQTWVFGDLHLGFCRDILIWAERRLGRHSCLLNLALPKLHIILWVSRRIIGSILLLVRVSAAGGTWALFRSRISRHWNRMVLACSYLLFASLSRDVTRLVNHLRNPGSRRLDGIVGPLQVGCGRVIGLSLVIGAVLSCLNLMFIFIHRSNLNYIK